eukprot:3177421-Amphidinium_carterae.2
MEACSRPRSLRVARLTPGPDILPARASNPKLATTPENNATAFPTIQLQKPETCKKPGTAFTAAYKIPGADVSTHAKNHKLGTLETAGCAMAFPCRCNVPYIR